MEQARIKISGSFRSDGFDYVSVKLQGIVDGKRHSSDGIKLHGEDKAVAVRAVLYASGYPETRTLPSLAGSSGRYLPFTLDDTGRIMLPVSNGVQEALSIKLDSIKLNNREYAPPADDSIDDDDFADE